MSMRAPLGYAALGASFALHIGVAFALGGGHGAQAATPSDSIIAIDVANAPADDVVPTPATPALPEHATTSTVATTAPAAPADPSKIRVDSLRNNAAPDNAPAAAPSAETAANDDVPSFAMVVGGAAIAPGGATTARPDGGVVLGGKSDVVDSNGVDELARLVSGPQPTYPLEAREQGIEADVPLDIVVDSGGRVTDVHSTKHFGHGLDEAASAAIRTWRFTPAKRGGVAVSVRVRWTVTFRLFEN